MGSKKNNVSMITLGVAMMFAVGVASATAIDFRGQLDIISVDEGGAVYSDVAIGPDFFGAIDDVTFNGFISDSTADM